MPTARCESCKSSFETEGMSAVCPLCGQLAQVDLTIRVLCSCGTTLKAPPKMRGRVITCPRCTRPVPIPRGDEAEEEKGTVQVGKKTRWVFALAVLPIFVGLQGDRDDPRKRVDRTLTNYKIDGSSARTLSEKVALIPGGKAERAAMPRESPLPYVYGAAGFALILGFVWLSFGTPKLGTRQLALGAIAGALGGMSLGIIIKWVLPAPADADSAPRLFAVAALAGAGAEVFKTWWIVMLRGKLPRRALLLLGLSIGTGFGAANAMLSGEAMAGVALPRAFWIEFVSLVALQAAWSGTAALFVSRGGKQQMSMGARIFAAAGAPIALHAAFEFFHRQEMFLGSLVAGLASFALFHALHYWTEETEEETIAGETIRL